MTSLTDLFNPTFLMFLGILVLVVALIVVYFESKMREQNHKINSMFSIVSTLAEDMTGMKMGINQIAGTQFLQPANERTYYQPLEEKRESTLITVSDDEDEEDEDDSIVEEGSVDSISINNIEDVDLDVDDDLDELSDDELSEEQEQEQEQIKVFKLNISKEEKDEEEEDDDEEDEDMEELHSDNDLDDLEETTPIDPVSKIDISELKTISINLEESVEKIDYKKLQLPKLKSIVVEKGLTTASDASKLKKAELLKLLGIE
jgi:hypothetical protein